jgi:class 3 adenylate cyclase
MADAARSRPRIELNHLGGNHQCHRRICSHEEVGDTISTSDQMPDLPIGHVTFLFTDIEGSTKLLQRLGDRYAAVIEAHGHILREAIARGDGTEVGTEGDAFFAVFRAPTGALEAAVEAQRALAGHRWPEGNSVRVRMGIHTGLALLSGDDYIGLDIHLAARIAAAAHGGQVLVSEFTRPLVEHALPDGVSLRDLGRHRLKDIDQPIHLWDVVIAGLPSEFPAIRSLDARPTNLPKQRTSFVGREREVADVTELLTRSRLVTLTGPGGTGKTRLAVKVAGDLLDRFPDGVFFVDLSPIIDAALVPSAIAQALVVREEPGRDLLETLGDHLRDRHELLVLDNTEQVIESGLAVARLLDSALRLAILVTSRAPLHISGELEYHVPPMSIPDPERASDVELITRSEAVTLFGERAAAVRTGFRITAENAVAVAEVTVRLDGLPLAIELAASRLNLLTRQALLDRLTERLPLLTGPGTVRSVTGRYAEPSRGATTCSSQTSACSSPAFPCSRAGGPLNPLTPCVARVRSLTSWKDRAPWWTRALSVASSSRRASQGSRCSRRSANTRPSSWP